MKLKQLSLFLENKPGHVARACRLLAEAGINIETMALADTEQFGILRVIVTDTARAKQVFASHGVVAKETDVVAVLVPHRPGGLADILEVLDGGGLNIEYMYGFHANVDGNAIIVFRFDNSDLAITRLQEHGVKILDAASLMA
ncbi:MAG: ACT domain-containing protein [Thermoguttaceae bacterium]